MKNITGSLIVVTIILGGYYYFNKNSADLTEGDSSLTGEMLLSTQVFMERRVVLEKTKVDTEIFSSPIFKSYKTFNKPVLKEKLGRENPFGRVTGQNNSQ